MNLIMQMPYLWRKGNGHVKEHESENKESIWESAIYKGTGGDNNIVCTYSHRSI